ncbi:hypothetical protein SDC9_142338 [bioreactor metagenome]|uniref:Uncharacterized protein n=1 Tax=bioreactor metagenome TaxID=1076179 RepID=A0A645E0U8_9ZZZZ
MIGVPALFGGRVCAVEQLAYFHALVFNLIDPENHRDGIADDGAQLLGVDHLAQRRHLA